MIAGSAPSARPPAFRARALPRPVFAPVVGWVGAAAALLVVGACASSGGSGGDAPVRPLRLACPPPNLEEGTVPLAPVLDSARVATRFRGIMGVGHQLVAQLRWDGAAVDSVAFFGAPLEDSMRSEVSVALQESVLPAEVHPSILWILLSSVEPPSVRGFRDTSSCEPELAERRVFERKLAALSEGSTEKTVTVRALVGPDGRVEHAELIGTTDRRRTDEGILQATREALFFPAELGGIRVASWVEFPVRVSIRHPILQWRNE